MSSIATDVKAKLKKSAFSYHFSLNGVLTYCKGLFLIKLLRKFFNIDIIKNKNTF